MTAFSIDLSLNNSALYTGCTTEEVGGRLNLVTPPQEASNMVGRNAQKMVDECENRDSVTLTGPMAVWSYLVVFHVVLHKFRRVYYDDGRTGPVLIAAHG